MKLSSFSPLLIVVLIILSTTAVALAADERENNATATRPGFLQREERKAELTETLGAKREAFQTRMEQFRAEKIDSMLSLMKRRFAAAIERLEGIADRIEARIEKIEDAEDTTLDDAREYLDDARDHLEDASELIDATDTSSAAELFDNASTTGNGFGRLRTLFSEAKASIKAAQMSLRDALRAIGQSRGGEKPATTTPSN